MINSNLYVMFHGQTSIYSIFFFISRFLNTLHLSGIQKGKYLCYPQIWWEQPYLYFLHQNQILLEEDILEGKVILASCTVLHLPFSGFLILIMMDLYPSQSKLRTLVLQCQAKIQMHVSTVLICKNFMTVDSFG